MPKIKESIPIVHKVLNLIKFDKFVENHKNFIAVDFKMYSMLLKIKGTSARHPCINCQWNSYGESETGEKRTLKTWQDNWEKLKSGAQPKECGGLKAEPRWAMLKNIETGSLVLAPPQLHIFLGMVKAFMDKLAKLATNKQKKDIFSKWLKPAGIGEKPYFAGTYRVFFEISLILFLTLKVPPSGGYHENHLF